VHRRGHRRGTAVAGENPTSRSRRWSSIRTASYRSALVNPTVRGKARAALGEAARAGGNLDPRNARYVRVIEYEVPDREGDGTDEVIAPDHHHRGLPGRPCGRPRAGLSRKMGARDRERPAQDLPPRAPGKILRSESPDMVRQEIWGYLLTHYAISALICTAATNAGIDPDRVKFQKDGPHHPPPGR